MRLDYLTLKEWRKLADMIGRQCDYLRRLVTRMKEQGFPTRDPLFVKTDDAYRYMRGLYRETQARLNRLSES